jgi:aminoglycoside/choline kinase family phosphotransferase
MPAGEVVQWQLDGFSTHPIARVRLTLADGRRVRAVLKRIGPAPGRDPRREVLVYRRLLAGARHGAPELYGSVCRGDGSMLLLEDVGDRRLERCGIERWLETFAWLGRLHAEWRGREAELRALACLAEHDAGHHAALAEAAARTVWACGEPRAARRLEAMLDRWLGVTIGVLDAQPRTLLHGDLSGHNAMVQRQRAVAIRPVDWEWAAVGSAAWDVARLLAGWDSRGRALLDAYLDAGGRHGNGDFDAALAHGDVLRRLWYLRWWASWCDDPAHVDALLDGMERVWREAA